MEKVVPQCLKLMLIVSIYNIKTCSSSNGLICYQCGTGAPNDWQYPMTPEIEEAEWDMESCESFSSAFSWGSFALHCGEFQLCGKTVTGYGESVVRGCVSRNDSRGYRHPLGCGQMMSNRVEPSNSEFDLGDEICLCDTNYCNSANFGGGNCYLTFIFVLVLRIVLKIQMKI